MLSFFLFVSLGCPMALRLSSPFFFLSSTSANNDKLDSCRRRRRWLGGGGRGGVQVESNRQRLVKAEAKPSRSGAEGELGVGSPIVVVEAPAALKTAEPVPRLKINHGYVKQGDVGRIVGRKPKDVWAVRLSAGTFLIDSKYFKPLDVDE